MPPRDGFVQGAAQGHEERELYQHMRDQEVSETELQEAMIVSCGIRDLYDFKLGMGFIEPI